MNRALAFPPPWLQHRRPSTDMHPSSFDKMAAFCRDHLDSRRDERLEVLDLGSYDVNGSYRPIFDAPAWHYVGADIAPGPNVDLVLRDPYDWRELRSESVDVLVSGQTFEHTEFFWETALEIARVLKPGGLCCIIVPSAGPEHRFPVDCWRMYPDGLRAIARYAGLDPIQASAQWHPLPGYDDESNKWHESVLIARKPKERRHALFVERLDRWWRRRLRAARHVPQAMIQVFHSRDGIHTEENSVAAYIGYEKWQDVAIVLPPGAGSSPLRIDFVCPSTVVELKYIRVDSLGQVRFEAANVNEFNAVELAGDLERVADAECLRLKITGVDPQLRLPIFETTPASDPLTVRLRLRISAVR